MSNVTLYELSHEYKDLYNALMDSIDEETGEVDVDIVSALDRIHGRFEEKAIATATVYREIEDYETRIDAAMERLKAKRERAKKEKEKIAKYLTLACEETGTESIYGVYASISFRKSTQAVIDDESLLPKEFIVETVKVKPDKVGIKNAIKSGQNVPGAHIEELRNIQIK